MTRIGDAVYRVRGARQVVMPEFHKKSVNDGIAWQIDPRWTAVTQ